jgi:choline monooxygenase
MLSGEFSYSYDGRQSKMEASITEKSMVKWRRISRHFGSRSIQTDTYYHYLVFPLFTVASTFGVSFSLQTFRPLAPDRTLLTSRLFLARLEASGGAVEAALAGSAKSFNRTVFLEDKFVCEQVQLGMQQKGAPPGILGKYEQRLAHFQESVAEFFGYT